MPKKRIKTADLETLRALIPAGEWKTGSRGSWGISIKTKSEDEHIADVKMPGTVDQMVACSDMISLTPELADEVLDLRKTRRENSIRKITSLIEWLEADPDNIHLLPADGVAKLREHIDRSLATKALAADLQANAGMKRVTHSDGQMRVRVHGSQRIWIVDFMEPNGRFYAVSEDGDSGRTFNRDDLAEIIRDAR